MLNAQFWKYTTYHPCDSFGYLCSPMLNYCISTNKITLCCVKKARLVWHGVRLIPTPLLRIPLERNSASRTDSVPHSFRSVILQPEINMEPASASTAKSSSAYGHACAACVKAKCKCIPRAGGSCERCVRKRVTKRHTLHYAHCWC